MTQVVNPPGRETVPTTNGMVEVWCFKLSISPQEKRSVMHNAITFILNYNNKFLIEVIESGISALVNRDVTRKLISKSLDSNERINNQLIISISNVALESNDIVLDIIFL